MVFEVSVLQALPVSHDINDRIDGNVEFGLRG
jgi:hypothetical protein